MERSPSGEQWTIAAGDQAVTVVQVGGGIRTYRAGGQDVLAGYGVDDVATSGRGQLLLPWPNRIRDGRYELDGVAHQLALTEPERHNASHGLVRWALWQLEHRSDSELTVSYPLHPQPGWDWHLDLSVTYRLGDDGLVVDVAATNSGTGEAPVGVGAHPYIALGGAPVGRVDLHVPADTYLQVDPERMLPTGTASVEGRPEDFRSPHPIGEVDLDTAYTDLARGEDGRWRIRLDGLAGGRAVVVWGGPGLDWAQVFTGRARRDPYGADPGVAVEPMSCPPDAFNSGAGLLRLGPGQSWSARWGVRPEG